MKRVRYRSMGHDLWFDTEPEHVAHPYLKFAPTNALVVLRLGVLFLLAEWRLILGLSLAGLAFGWRGICIGFAYRTLQ